MNIDTSRDYACKLDTADELSGYREKFFNADSAMIYMDGNSLGKLPLRTVERVEQIILQQDAQHLSPVGMFFQNQKSEVQRHR